MVIHKNILNIKHKIGIYNFRCVITGYLCIDIHFLRYKDMSRHQWSFEPERGGIAGVEPDPDPHHHFEATHGVTLNSSLSLSLSSKQPLEPRPIYRDGLAVVRVS